MGVSKKGISNKEDLKKGTSKKAKGATRAAQDPLNRLTSDYSGYGGPPPPGMNNLGPWAGDPLTPRWNTPEAAVTPSGEVTSTSKTGFFSLSGELRNIIYRLALVHESALYVYVGRPHHVMTDALNDPPARALLHVSRQIRLEASSIYYGENMFSIHNDNGPYTQKDKRRTANVTNFQTWLADLGENARWIKRLHICTTHCSGFSDTMDIAAYVKFAAQHPDVSVEVNEELCARCDSWSPMSATMNLVPLAQKLALLNMPAWVDEIKAGNIAGMRVMVIQNTPPSSLWLPFGAPNPRWIFRLASVSYSIEATKQLKGMGKWQALCEKLSLSSSFELMPGSSRGSRFSMRVAATPRDDAMVVD
jgi:hypothetical protein